MTDDCSKCVALVTGGSSGLGRGIVVALVEAGARVCVLDLHDDHDGYQWDEKKVIHVKGNVTSEDDVKRALDVCKTSFGGLNWLINSAGRACSGNSITYDQTTKQSADLKDFIDVIMVNTVGTFNCCRLAASLMSENTPDGDGSRGVIVNISSIHGMEGIKGVLAYSASKAAVNGMTLPMARDLAHIGVRVVTIASGSCDTPLFHSFVNDTDEMEALKKEILHPKRLIKPAELARFTLEILKNPMINGETIRFDAGARHAMLEC